MAYMVFCPCVLKISNHFIHFSPRNDEVNVKNDVSRDKGAWLIASKSRRPMLKNHGSARYKIIVMLRDLISREFSPSRSSFCSIGLFYREDFTDLFYPVGIFCWVEVKIQKNHT